MIFGSDVVKKQKVYGNFRVADGNLRKFSLLASEK